MGNKNQQEEKNQEANQVKHLQGYITSLIKVNWETKWSKARWMVKVEPMMKVSFANEGKIQDRKTL
jgi:hypothetical protein